MSPEGTAADATGPCGRFRTLRPGRLPYREALALQERLLERCAAGGGDVLILLEHPPVVTCGRRTRPEHLRLPEEKLQARGIELAAAGRGGEATFHGPGQLVGYPIVDLNRLGRDLHRFLRLLEATLIEALAAFDVAAERRPGRTGVWVEGRKIASIGVGVRRWISWHGFALNVGADLSGFDTIVPCGLEGVRMTSLERLLGRPVPMPQVEAAVIGSFAGVFGFEDAGAYGI